MYPTTIAIVIAGVLTLVGLAILLRAVLANRRLRLRALVRRNSDMRSRRRSRRRSVGESQGLSLDALRNPGPITNEATR